MGYTSVDCTGKATADLFLSWWILGLNTVDFFAYRGVFRASHHVLMLVAQIRPRQRKGYP